MTNEPLFSSGATDRETAEEGAIRVTSIREIAEQKLNQLGVYIRGAYRSEEDDRWKSFKEPR
jgi:hypothetical protein